MIIFLYGKDSYRLRQKLNEIIEHYKKIHKSGLNLKYFDEDNFSSEEFEDEFQTTSMFKEKKLIIIKNVLNGLINKKNFFDLVRKLKKTEDIIVIYEKKESANNKTQFKFLKKYSKSQEFQPLGGEKLKIWLKKEFVNYQTEISQVALDKLIYFVGNDLWQLNNEIKKLVIFKERKKIELEDIELLVKPRIETDIFKTIDAIASKNRKQAISLIHKHLEKGDNPVYLLSMITFQFRNLLIIKYLIEKNRPYSTILKTTNLHPFVVKKSYQQANKFTLSELKKIYQKIFRADLLIKTGKVNAETALDLLLTEI